MGQMPSFRRDEYDQSSQIASIWEYCLVAFALGLSVAVINYMGWWDELKWALAAIGFFAVVRLLGKWAAASRREANIFQANQKRE